MKVYETTVPLTEAENVLGHLLHHNTVLSTNNLLSIEQHEFHKAGCLVQIGS